MLQTRDGGGIVLQNQAVRPHDRERVEVLAQEQNVHHVLRLRPPHLLAKFRHGRLQPLHDGLPLPSHAQSGQVPGLRLRLGVLHLADLVGLRLVGRRLLQAPRGVDLVHRRLDLRVGGEVGHEGVHNAVPVILHDGLELLQHGLSDVVLGLERLVQLHAGDGGPDDVVHVRLDLAGGAREAVPRVVGGLGHHLVLHGHADLDEDVVLSFRLAEDIELLDAEGEAADDRLQRPENAAGALAHKSFELA
mmetsp:Transcript_24740/g.52736  ORF Transcript_24740/g.52736 Transcript_24740/m.52736 type:complete len:247 (-) Transcript_24740:248-988(-)